MVLNVTFNNISVISRRSILLVGETGVTGEYHRTVANYWQTLSHNVVLGTPRHERGSNSQIQLPYDPDYSSLVIYNWKLYIE
jgi:hypothetical protein